jgi:predicted N-acetyltransferase YhbS
VLPAHGRRGVGAALVRAVCAWARERGLPSVTLTTYRDVPWNAPFYTRLGFRTLRAAELGPKLRALVASEDAHGLRRAERVVMRYQTGAGR